MRPTSWIGPAILLGYSLVLAGGEIARPEAARFYLEDPPERVLFGHVNTWLSSVLLAVICATFLAIGRVRRLRGERLPVFEISQAILFAALSVDERFRLLPGLAAALDVPEAIPYAGLAGLELGLLAGTGRLRGRRELLLVGAAGGAFLLSMLLDPWPARGLLRRSAEELPKVWGAALFLAFAARRLGAEWIALADLAMPGQALRWGRDRRRAAAQARPESGPEMQRAPARRADAPEPVPEDGDFVASAAPPRKLLSH